MPRDVKTRPKRQDSDGSKREAELFYRRTVKDSAKFLEAMDAEGLDEELALLRMRFEQMMREKNADLDAVLRAAEMIGRTVMRRHRISPKRTDEMAENIAAAMKSIAEQLFPERFEV